MGCFLDYFPFPTFLYDYNDLIICKFLEQFLDERFGCDEVTSQTSVTDKAKAEAATRAIFAIIDSVSPIDAIDSTLKSLQHLSETSNSRTFLFATHRDLKLVY